MRGDGPLRYPGAKSNLAHYVAAFIERHRLVGLDFAEPFAGSAAVSRYLLGQRLVRTAALYEADPGAYAFWHAALHRNDELRARMAAAPVTLDEFDRCKAYLFGIDGVPRDTVEAGYAFLFLNRTSYSGIVGAGPIGGRSQSSQYPIDCRFNKDMLDKQLVTIAGLSSRLNVTFGDGIAALSDLGNETFLYVDPPYFANGKKFYRKYFSTFDHYRLRKALAGSSAPWLLSYDYDRKVEYLYRDFPTQIIDLYHSAREAGSKREIVASSLGFAGVACVELQAAEEVRQVL